MATPKVIDTVRRDDRKRTLINIIGEWFDENPNVDDVDYKRGEVCTDDNAFFDINNLAERLLEIDDWTMDMEITDNGKK